MPAHSELQELRIVRILIKTNNFNCVRLSAAKSKTLGIVCETSESLSGLSLTALCPITVKEAGIAL